MYSSERNISISSEVDKLIADANEQAKKILELAEERAAKIIADAQHEANKITGVNKEANNYTYGNTRVILDTAFESSSIVANSSTSKLHSPFINRRRSITTRNALRLSYIPLTCTTVSFLRKFVLLLTVLLRR